jgi:CSLREA domain-containing protein
MKLVRFLTLTFVLLGLALINVPHVSADTTYVVNSIGDESDTNMRDGICAASTGLCTLRAAIEQTNATIGTDTIIFNLPAPATVFVIRPASRLPIMAETVIIDGTTQPGYVDHPIIELDGSLLSIGSHSAGLVLTGGRSVVRGLSIYSFDYGIYFAGGNENVIEGNYLGVRSNGIVAPGNHWIGVVVESSSNLIGGSSGAIKGDLCVMPCNVISGNGVGVAIRASTGGTADEARSNRVLGNLIGTDVSGILDLGNQVGVQVQTSKNNVGYASLFYLEERLRPGNVISGNDRAGVWIEGVDAFHNNIALNDIGVGNGSGPIANGTGVLLVDGAHHNKVGLVDGGRAGGNIIMGNIDNGVQIASAPSNIVAGNQIGGSSPNGFPNGGYGVSIESSANTQVGLAQANGRNHIIGNAYSGVRIYGMTATNNTVRSNTIAENDENGIVIVDAPQNTVGGSVYNQRNYIWGNGAFGINIYGPESIGNVVQGNRIGVKDHLMTPGPNGTGGISLGSTTNTLVGGTTGIMPNKCEGACNLIAFNEGPGVRIADESGAVPQGNTIQGNAIYANVDRIYPGIGIDLEDGTGGGVTPNDGDDSDGGANRLQNFPEITSATTNGTALTINGILETRPGNRYRIEFFANAACDPSGYGEGEVFIGTVEVRTPGSGRVPISASLPHVPAGQFITATATRIDNGDTSEFSACTEVTMSTSMMIIIRIDNLIGTIIKLGDANILVPSQEKTLVKLHTGAIKQIEKGKPEAALEKLGAAVNKLAAWVKEGQIDPQTGQMLIDETNAIIEMINDPGKSSSDQE